MRISLVLIIPLVFFLLLSCRRKGRVFEKKNPEPKEQAIARQQMMNTDVAFSAMSEKEGMKKAFLEYIDNEGILLRPNHMPIVGADAIDYLSQVNDSAFTLTWKPDAAFVSASCDLGFTYGLYKIVLKDTSMDGTYVSIWKKQEDGRWKFTLDTGNEGTGKPKMP